MTILSQVQSETEAYLTRNEHRALDKFSITGPTCWPASTHKRACEEHPDRIQQIKTAFATRSAHKKAIAKLMSLDRAWDAICDDKHGLPNATLFMLRDVYGVQFKKDAFSMTPDAFLTKYGLTLE